MKKEIIMKNRKIIIVLCITCVVFLGLFLIKSGGPSNGLTCEVNLSSVPENTVFVELFVDEQMLGDDYTSYNKKAVVKNNMDIDSSVITANYNGFISYTYHCKNSYSDSDLRECAVGISSNDEKCAYVNFGFDDEQKIIKNFDSMSFVYVDDKGEVLGKTEVVSISKFFGVNRLFINGEKTAVKYSVKPDNVLWLFVMTFFIECLMFCFFKIRAKKHSRKR